ncbi:MAG: hypothetical protein M4579_005093 [Chaenotheca gracillima]|nr:MAG: hypothetical protein M4579_005093 [Chaenotheca gracillima]
MSMASYTSEYGAPSQPTDDSLQVVFLGTGGGPNEDNVSGVLFHSTCVGWSKGSIVAVDAGVHLAAISKILHKPLQLPNSEQKEDDKDSNSSSIQNGMRQPDVHPIYGRAPSDPSPVFPFQGLRMPFKSALANAAFITRDLISTFLITHPHLDHLSGFVINSAAFQQTSRPKILAALPSTINAIKAHIFNDVIWPNLSDEDGGVGLVNYRRLVDGGNRALGEGSGRGYIEVCEGISVKSYSVSHGHYMGTPNPPTTTHGSVASSTTSPDAERSRRPCAYDSTAFFIRSVACGREVLIFGDVEPDSLSIAPRNARVWDEAAPKIAEGSLKAIFIECSFENAQPDEALYGHLAPRHLFAELQTLARKVRQVRSARDGAPNVANTSAFRAHPSPYVASRDSLSNHNPSVGARSEYHSNEQVNGNKRKRSITNGVVEEQLIEPQTPTLERPPLLGLHVIIVHTKNFLRDGPSLGTKVMAQLEEYEYHAGLGCIFSLPTVGSTMFF